MPHTIFHIIPKNIEEEHIAANVQPACVDKLRSDEGKIDQIRRLKRQTRWHPRERGLRNAMRYRRGYNPIRKHKRRGIGTERYLIQKDHTIYNDQPPRDPWQTSSRSCIILNRNHKLPPAPLQVGMTYCINQAILIGVLFTRRGRCSFATMYKEWRVVQPVTKQEEACDSY